MRGSEYEWAQHAVLAGDAGIDEDEVARIALGPDAPGWSPVDGAMVRSVDELIGAGAVSGATWKVLAAELDDQQLMDLVFTVGAYEVLAMFLRSFEIDLDDDLKRK